LCINSALKKDPVCRTVAAARRLVSHFKKSAKATTALAEKQRELNVAEHKLVQDVATRWKSVYLMLDRLLEQRGAVSAVLTDSSVSKRSDRDLELTTSQWRMAEDIVNVLKPMIKLTELLSQDMNAFLSATVPLLLNINKRHLVVHEDDSAVTKTLKITLTEEIDRRWELKAVFWRAVFISRQQFLTHVLRSFPFSLMMSKGMRRMLWWKIWLRV
jgi:hypothetical protein